MNRLIDEIVKYAADNYGEIKSDHHRKNLKRIIKNNIMVLRSDSILEDNSLLKIDHNELKKMHTNKVFLQIAKALEGKIKINQERICLQDSWDNKIPNATKFYSEFYYIENER